MKRKLKVRLMITKSKAKRVFIGIPISKKLQGFIKSWTSTNLKGKSLKITPTANLHITLTPPWNERETNIIADKLGKITNVIRPFEIQFVKLRLGPDKRHPRLIWLEGKLSEEVVNLKNNLEKLLDIKGEKRKFLPHITIARFNQKNYKKLNPNKLGIKVDWKEKVESVCFYESKLTLHGSQYKILKVVKFS